MLLSFPKFPLIAAPHWFANSKVMPLLRSRHIYLHQMYCTMLQGSGVAGVTIIREISFSFSIIAAAGVYPQVKGIPKWSCYLQSQGSSRSQLITPPNCNTKYLVQWFSCTGWLLPIPLPSLVATVKYNFQDDGISDHSQYSCSSASCSLRRIQSILLKVFKGLGLNNIQGLLARSNQLVWKLHLLLYFCIQIR